MSDVRISRSIFRAYDVRGVVGDDFGETQAFMLGRAPATLYPGCGEVAVGRDGRERFTIHPGDRVAQLMFVPVAHPGFDVVEEFTESPRGAGGFGHTGRE